MSYEPERYDEHSPRKVCEQNRAERLIEYVATRWKLEDPNTPEFHRRVKQAARLPSRIVKAQLKGRVWPP